MRSDRQDAATGHREVPLPGGGVLTVRPVGPGDVDGLVTLYEGLSEEDRYRRFFSSFHPPRSFLEHLCTVVSRGGYGVVAVDPDGRIVGEANYEMLPNGDGELGMTVLSGWRGWLGPYLLDTLVEAAAARGVPNIEAEVLATNAGMLAILRARGYATLPSDDWVSFRLVTGTGGHTPVWPPVDPEGSDTGRRPRVLVEAPGGRWFGTAEAEAAGLAVVTCSGPRGPRPRCPVLAGRPCPLVADADAVVVANAPGDETWRALIAGHEDLHPGVPVCVEPRGGPRLALSVVDRAARRHRHAGPASTPKAGGASCMP